jgi:predicted transcriptional regulator/plasmid maintenance system antidote protein VapI
MREQRGWNQQLLAQRLQLSLSYVSQIENNQRPVTAAILLKLAELFGADIGQFSEDQEKRQLAELDCALHDRTLRAEPASPASLARMIEQAPELVDAFLTLYQRYGHLQEQYAVATERYYGELGGTGRQEALAPLPYEEVRDFFNRRNNYLDSLDRLGEELARTLQLRPGQGSAPLQQVLRQHCQVEVEITDAGSAYLRRYQPAQHRLQVAAGLNDAQQAFQIATQYALHLHADVIEREIKDGGLVSEASCALARQGLAHYFAAAVLLPYADFLAKAQGCRYDIELLQQHFHVSFETVCHRLSTLQRAGARGVPFYFVRVDQAGNISKRQSATAFHFARHGGACPLWHVHEAFAQPGRILGQVAEMPDGTRFFGIARTIERGGGGYKTRRKSFAIGLGCELSRAGELVYAEGIDVNAPHEVVPIGPGCRMCPRENCVQRAFPPSGRPLLVDADLESLVSYRF